ncbi:hypothetical protein [Actinomadura nitritigenes]
MIKETPAVLTPAKPGPTALRDRTAEAAAHEGGGARRVPSTEPAWGSASA